jgi:hypothetical protein
MQIEGSSNSATHVVNSSVQAGGNAVFNINLNDLPGVMNDALTAFKKEASKTPEERCRDDVMKEWHVTDSSIRAMPVQEAKKLIAKIDAEVAKRMQLATGADSGFASPTDGASPTAVSATPSPSTLDVLSSRLTVSNNH